MPVCANICVCVSMCPCVCVSVCRVRLHQPAGPAAEYSAAYGVRVAVTEDEGLQDCGG